MIKLFIDSSDSDKGIVTLEINGKRHDASSLKGRNSQVILPLIVKQLKKHKIKLAEIDEIYVSEGPGSFTGLRVGVSVANALSQVMKVPLNGKVGKLVEVKYK